MDVNTVTSFRRAVTRADLALRDGEAFLAGGTWIMSEPQPDTTGLVDLTSLGWDRIEVSEDGLRIGATCTIAELLRWATGDTAPTHWRGLGIVEPAANALLASFKIWNTATVGGNLCRTFAAGAIISLAVALDGVVEVWRPDGTDYDLPAAALPTGNGTNVLRPGEVVRSVFLPDRALRGRARLHKIALAELGRSGAVVTGRLDEDGRATFAVTAATSVPETLVFPALPGTSELADAVAQLRTYYSDPLGAADWRRGVSMVLAARIRRELRALSEEPTR